MTNPRYRLTAEAKIDIGEIWLYIAQDDVTAADRFVDRLLDRCLQLSEQPGIGRRREELAHGLRSSVVGNYLIFYRAVEDVVEIVRVLSGYRDIDAVFEPS